MSYPWLDSIAHIESSNPANKDFGTCFSVYWDGRATYFATCAHVIEAVGGPGKIVVSLKAREKDNAPSKNFQAELVASGDSSGIDLAILRVEGLQTPSILPLRSTSPEQNTLFYTAGYSSPDKNHFEFKTFQGSFGPKRQLGGRQQRETRQYIDAWDLKLPNNDAHLQPGHSGSPIIDENHYAIAVVTSMRAEGSEGTAISIEALKFIWKDIPPGLFLPWQIPGCCVGMILKRGQESVVCEGWYHESQEKAEEQVAIKFLPLDQPTEAFLHYFEPNVRTFQDALDPHKHIVTLKACGVLSEYAYLIMEYTPGKSLDDRINSDQLIPFNMRLNYLLEVAEALNYAHSKYIAHGNMKLSNFLLGKEGILLSDFEMLTRHAKGRVDISSAMFILTQGSVQKEREWKDQYDLAAIAFLLLTAALSLEEGRRRLYSTHSDIARALDRALAPDSMNRYPTMLDFYRTLRQARLSEGETQPLDLLLVPPNTLSPSNLLAQVGSERHEGILLPPEPLPVNSLSDTSSSPSPGSSLEPPQGTRPHSTFSRPTKLTKRIQSLPLWQRIGLLLLVLVILGGSLVVVFNASHSSQSSDTCNSPGDGSIPLFIGTDFPTSEKDGSAAKFGADLAIRENHNLGQGYTLNPCDKDDASGNPPHHNPDLGAQNMTLFANDPRVLGVVGPENSNVALKEIPIAVSAGLVMISPSTTNPCLTLSQYCTSQGLDPNQVHPPGKVNTYFRICGNDLRQAEADATLLFQSLGIHTVSVVDDGEVYGQGLAQAFSDNFAANPGAVILGDRFHISSKNTPAQLADTAAHIVKLHPQAVFYAGSASNQPGAFKQQLSLQGFTGSFVGGDGIGSNNAFLQDAKSDANNTYATSLGPDPSDFPHPGSFVQDYEAIYGTPTSWSALGYDAAMILIKAIQNAVKEHSQNMRNAVRDYVQNIQYPGVTGVITFDSNGDNSGPKIFSVYAAEQGTWVYRKEYTITVH